MLDLFWFTSDPVGIRTPDPQPRKKKRLLLYLKNKYDYSKAPQYENIIIKS